MVQTLLEYTDTANNIRSHRSNFANVTNVPLDFSQMPQKERWSKVMLGHVITLESTQLFLVLEKHSHDHSAVKIKN